MKKNYLILFLLMSFISLAQGKKFNEKKEQLKSMKTAFLTSELQLSTSEAEKFWPIYNQFDNKQFEIRHRKMRNLMMQIEDMDMNNVSERDANALLTQLENLEDEMYQNKKRLFNNLVGVIPSVKIIKLRKAEEDFNKTLLKQFKENNGPRR